MTRILKTLALISTLIAVIVVGAMPAIASPDAKPTAQTSSTYVLSEATINASYRVTSTPRVRVDSKSVDLQPGQAVLTANITPRNQDPYQTVVVMTPRIDGVSVVWDVASVTVNGQPATSDQLSQINSALVLSYRRYLKTTINRISVTGVEVTANEIIYTYTPRTTQR